MSIPSDAVPRCKRLRTTLSAFTSESPSTMTSTTPFAQNFSPSCLQVGFHSNSFSTMRINHFGTH